jgi:predicted Mrr-cat superfamily restriction endonuclease
VKAWFLRVAYPAINRESIQAARLAPILFRKIPLSDLHVDMGAGEIGGVVNKFYKTESPRTRGQHAGTLRRFLSDANVGDVVGIRVNKESKLIFGRLADGDLRLFPRLEDENIKARPLALLADREQDEMAKGYPSQ